MPLSALSPYAAPFVPGPGTTNEPATGFGENMEAFSFKDVHDQWMWGDVSQMMAFPASTFFVPNINSPSSPMAPFFANFPSYPPPLLQACSFEGPPVAGRRRRRRGRRKNAASEEESGTTTTTTTSLILPENNSKLQNCTRVKLFRETGSQTDFQQSIREAALQPISSLNRCEVSLQTASHRTVKTTTACDLLRPPCPAPLPPPAPPAPPRINYAAAVKAAPVIPPAPSPLTAPVPVTAPSCGKSAVPASCGKTALGASSCGKAALSGSARKRGKKKVKAPLIDLEKVMRDREAERAASVLGAASAGWEEEKDAEFPGLLSEAAQRSAAEKLAVAWKTSRNPASVTLSDYVEIIAPKEEEKEAYPSLPSEIPSAKIPQKSSAAPKQSARVKFRPLFTVGGSSTQAERYRAKDVEKKGIEVDLQLRAQPLLKVKKPLVEVPVKKKVANPLDSAAVTKRGKERETPRPKRPSLMKKIILKEREERKRARGQLRPAAELDSGHQSCPETANSDADDSEDEQAAAQSAPEDTGCEEEREKAPVVKSAEADIPENAEADAVPDSWEDTAAERQTLCNLHSRRFREYCNQMIGKEINECVLALLADLVRFQDRLHARDPVKARQKRRMVCGFKEVTKHLKLHRLKLIIMSPDVERIESKGGLDDAVRSLLSLCEQHSVPYVFSLPRRMLGKALMKPVPIAVVGIFNYDGAECHVRRLSSLVEEGRAQYRLVTRITTAAAPELPCMWLAGHNRNTSEPLSDLSVS